MNPEHMKGDSETSIDHRRKMILDRQLDRQLKKLLEMRLKVFYNILRHA